MSVEYKSAAILKYIVKRVLQFIPLIFLIIIVTFMIIHLAPGDPIGIILGETATPELVQKFTEKWGLDKPLHEQLLLYISNVLHGDLGRSIWFTEPVFDLIAERTFATLLLLGVSFTLALVIGIIFGVIASKKPNSPQDNLITVTSLIGFSLPIFWFGMILLLIFARQFPLFPTGGMVSLRTQYSGIAYVGDVAYHLVLPVITLSAYLLAAITRLTRSGMLEVLSQDFILTARSKGLDDNTVFYRHALKNALLPVVTRAGMSIGMMFGGAVLTETVFSWPGLGRLLMEAILARDYPLIMGQLLIISIAVCVANLITDIIYVFLDPRVRYR